MIAIDLAKYSARACTAILLVQCVLSGGCCTTRPLHTTSISPPGHAIFNPMASPALADNRRADWPASEMPDTAEETAFHEHFVDIHDRGLGHTDGFLFRRFESNRVGRSRR